MDEIHRPYSPNPIGIVFLALVANASDNGLVKTSFSWTRVLATLCAVVPLMELLFPGCAFGVKAPPEAVAYNDVNSVRIALEHYISEFGAHPVGDHRQVIDSLCGENPRHVDLLGSRYLHVSKRGELLDPWKHPYRIDLTNAKSPAVYSFGRNGVDEKGAKGSDDITSWRQRGAGE